MNKLIHILLATSIVSIYSCNDSVVGSGNQPLGKIIFEAEYVNHAWGYQYSGSYAAEDGNVYTYDLGKSNIQWKDNPEGHYSEEELFLKFHHFDTLRSVIPADTILWGYNLALYVENGKNSDTVNTGADMGAMLYSVYLFDPEKKMYQKIILSQYGDWQWHNTSESAIALAHWIQRSVK